MPSNYGENATIRKTTKQFSLYLTMYAPSLLSIARDHGIRVEQYPLQRSDGVAIRAGGESFIVVRPGMDERRHRHTFAHELAHLFDGSLGDRYCHISERRAEAIALEILIPFHLLREAIEDGHTEYSTLASIFGVSEEMVER